MGSTREEVLLRFVQLAVGLPVPAKLLHELGQAVAEVSSSGAGVVVQVGDGAFTLVEHHGFDADEALRVQAWVEGLESVDADVGELLRQRLEGRFGAARVLPLVGHGAMFGALVLLYEGDADEELHFCLALVDLVTLGLDRAFRERQLEATYADLRASRDAQARSYRLGALGQMAAGVSHDLKNILNPLDLQLQLLRRLVPPDDEMVAETLDDMKEVIRRGVDTIDRLRDFSRQQPIDDVGDIDVDRLVEEARDIASARIVSAAAPRVTLRLELGTPSPARAMGSEVVAAVVNLVVNAIDATKDEPDPCEIVLRTRAEGPWVVIDVEDDGPGMAEEVAKRVFEPFFSTKGADGTGLGLSNVYAFARRSGGHVELETAVGRGARFSIYLPVA